jgi:hypothetical protein
MPSREGRLRSAFAGWLRDRLRARGVPEARMASLLRRREGWITRFEQGRSDDELSWAEAWDLIAVLGHVPAEVLAGLMHDTRATAEQQDPSDQSFVDHASRPDGDGQGASDELPA